MCLVSAQAIAVDTPRLTVVVPLPRQRPATGWAGRPGRRRDRPAFEQLVAQGKIHYFIGGGREMASGNSAGEIAAWVAQNYAATTVDGATVYDLTRQSS